MTNPSGSQEYGTEVVVVGGGPGGTTLAFLLARSGVDVQLLERQRDLDRSFRGFLFQPLILRIFDQMGVLGSVLELEHDTVDAPSVEIYGETIPVIEFSTFDEQYDYGILMEQPPLLRRLIDRADEYAEFEYRDATTVQDLVVEDGRIIGVEANDREASEEFDLRARLVVGADGRYSTVRAAADIDPGLLDSQLELIWFKLPADAVCGDLEARFNDGGVLGYFGIGGDESQLGYFVEKNEYSTLQSASIERFYERITAVDPTLDGALQEHVTSFRDTTLLDIEPGVSDRWIDDGLLLLGDAAHVASPIGGQGNGLAIADAVVAHRVICEALTEMEGPLPRESLREYEQTRRPTVETVLRFQRRSEWGLSAFVRRRHLVPASIRKPLFRGVVSFASRSPLSTRLGRQFAWGSWEPVDTAKFVDSGYHETRVS